MLEIFIGEQSQWLWMMAQFLVLAISLFFIYKQIKLHRQGNMLQAISAIDKKWNSNELIKYRIVICDRYTQNSLKIDRHESEILSFFEDLGIYLKRKVFDTELIWDKYSYCIEYYWIMYERNIAEFRADEKDNTWFDQFEYLNNEMKKYSKKIGLNYGSRTKVEVEKFIDGERQEAIPVKEVKVSIDDFN